MHQCDICKQTFELRSQLGGHRGSHTRRGEAPKSTKYAPMNGKCPDCGKKFETSQKLAGHRRLMHTPWELFKTDGRRKNFLLKERGHQCENCKLTEWIAQPIPLHLDHIDGNPTNSSKDNLRLLCPNCHAQTETYCGKNIGRPKCLKREKSDFPSYRSHSYVINQIGY